MKTTILSTFILVTLFFIGCEKETEKNIFDVTVQSLGMGCAPVISFDEKDISAVKKIAGTESDRTVYFAFGLNSDAIEKGQNLTATIRPIGGDDNVFCTFQSPTFPGVVIEKFQIKQ